MAADLLLPERLRRLRQVVTHERAIRAVVDTALKAFLAAVAAAVIVEDAPPDLGRLNQADWDRHAQEIAIAAAALWLARYSTARDTHKAVTLAAPGTATPFRTQTQERLAGFPHQVYEDLDRAIQARLASGRVNAEDLNSLVLQLLHLDNYADEADRITRTTTISAFNGGDHDGYAELARQGYQVTKSWLATPDLRVRETHAIAYGSLANHQIPIDAPFIVGGFFCQAPGDPSLPAEEAVNCRCTAIYQVGALVASAGDELKRKRKRKWPKGYDQGASHMTDVTITVGDADTVTEPELALPDGWRGRIAGLDFETADSRWLATPESGIRTRAYPMSFTYKHVGYDELIIGSLDRVWMDEDGTLWGEGQFDLANEDGRKYAGMLRDGMINMVSIDPDQVSAAYRVVGPDGKLVDGEIADYVNCYNDGFCNLMDGYKEMTVFEDWRLAGVALVPISAYTEARIEPVFGYTPTGPQPGDAVVDAIVAVSAVAMHTYRSDSFAVKATKPTPLQYNASGQVWGHVATWDACHMDFPGMCLTAPPAVDGFNRFHQHSARLEDGTLIAVGALTFGDGHESKGSLIASRRHYSDVATVAAKVVASEDEWGVFICGEFVPSFDMTLADVVCYAPLSGHWEPDPDLGGQLALIAAHAVVTPGFNVRSLVAAYSPDTGGHSLIITKQRARTNVRPEIDMDALVAAVETKLHDRAAKRERVMALSGRMNLAEHKAARVAAIRERMGL